MAALSQLSQLKRIVGAIIIITSLWFGAKITRSALYLRQLYIERTQIAELVRTQPPFTHVHQWQDALRAVDQNLRSLSQEVQPMLVLGAAFGKPANLHATADFAAETFTIGHDMIAIGQEVLSIEGLFAEGNMAPEPSTQMAAVARHAHELTQLAERAEELDSRLEALPTEPLPSALVASLRRGQELTKLLTAGLQLAPAAPGLLGFEQPRTYLVLVQNNHELRATGGFITAVGLLKVNAGQMELLDFVDSYQIANGAVEHPWAPAPMQRHLGIDLLFLRDANWSPDFPTTAQLARALYAQNQGVWVDGVIALDLRAVEILVSGLGALHVDGVEQPITRANFQAQMKEFWRNAPTVTPDAEIATADDWWRQRKDFMPLIAKALLERIGAGAVDYSHVALALFQALDERAIQLWAADADIYDVLASVGWNGALEPAPGADFLALVDSNFGYNKVDSVLQRSLDYRVNWPADPAQPGQAIATITYRHPLAATDRGCDHTPRYGDTYDEMIARCYFDYVRLYTPLGSRLIDVAGVERTTVQSAPAINGTQLFSAYFELPPGKEQQVTFYYELPPAIHPQTYQLLVRRQAGAGPLPVKLDIAGQTFQNIIAKGALQWQPTH